MKLVTHTECYSFSLKRLIICSLIYLMFFENLHWFKHSSTPMLVATWSAIFQKHGGLFKLPSAVVFSGHHTLGHCKQCWVIFQNWNCSPKVCTYFKDDSLCCQKALQQSYVIILHETVYESVHFPGL